MVADEGVATIDVDICDVNIAACTGFGKKVLEEGVAEGNLKIKVCLALL